LRRGLQHNATSWDNGCQKPPLLTPFLTPVAPRRARDRVPPLDYVQMASGSSRCQQVPVGTSRCPDVLLSPRTSLLGSIVARGACGRYPTTVTVGRRQKRAAFDAVFSVVPSVRPSLCQGRTAKTGWTFVNKLSNCHQHLTNHPQYPQPSIQN
jgi:hypothetical protein